MVQWLLGILLTSALDAGSPRSGLDALPRPSARDQAPVKIAGYPKGVPSPVFDPAQVVGFSGDGAEYGYCAANIARDPAITTCVTVLRDGTTMTRDP